MERMMIPAARKKATPANITLRNRRLPGFRNRDLRRVGLRLRAMFLFDGATTQMNHRNLAKIAGRRISVFPEKVIALPSMGLIFLVQLNQNDTRIWQM